MTADEHALATTVGPSPADHDPESHYEFRVAGHLATRWSAWFDGLTIASGDDGTTVIRGPVVDQTALHGLLQKLRDIGIPLVAVTQVTSNPTAEPSGSHHPEGELT